MSPLRAAIFFLLAGVAMSATAEQITCESRGGSAEPCGTVAAGSTVRIARQLSNSPCIEGRTWGTGPSNDSIWVSGGCRAVFDVQPPNNSTAQNAPQQFDRDDRDASQQNDRAADRSADWQRGYQDGQRGAFNDRTNSQDYRLGFRAGKDAAENDERYSAAGSSGRDEEQMGDEPREDEQQGRDEPRRDDRFEGSRHASADRLRAHARRACVEQAATDGSFRRDDIETTDVRWLGHGIFAVSLDTPDGRLTCTVDRDGNIQSMETR